MARQFHFWFRYNKLNFLFICEKFDLREIFRKRCADLFDVSWKILNCENRKIFIFFFIRFDLNIWTLICFLSGSTKIWIYFLNSWYKNYLWEMNSELDKTKVSWFAAWKTIGKKMSKHQQVEGFQWNVCLVSSWHKIRNPKKFEIHENFPSNLSRQTTFFWV